MADTFLPDIKVLTSGVMLYDAEAVLLNMRKVILRTKVWRMMWNRRKTHQLINGEACGVLLELVGSEVVLLGEEPTCN